MTLKRLKMLKEEFWQMNTAIFDEDVDGEKDYSIENSRSNTVYYIELIINEMERLNIKKF